MNFDFKPVRAALLDQIDLNQARYEEGMSAAKKSVPENLAPFLNGLHGPLGREMSTPLLVEARRQLCNKIYGQHVADNFVALNTFCETVESTLAAETVRCLRQPICAEGKVASTELLQRLDFLTPYYEIKMKVLPPQQQQLLQVVACPTSSERTLGSTTLDIAKDAQLERSTVAAQLSRLQGKGSVVQVGGREGHEQARGKLFTVKDVAFHAWLIMRCVARDSKREQLFLQLRERAIGSSGETFG